MGGGGRSSYQDRELGEGDQESPLWKSKEGSVKYLEMEAKEHRALRHKEIGQKDVFRAPEPFVCPGTNFPVGREIGS